MDNNMNDKIDRMREIARYAYEHTNFYRKLYANIDLDHVELPHGLPIVQSYDLLEKSLEFKSDAKIQKIAASSGTSGKPKLLFRTMEDLEYSINNQRELMRWCNVTEKDIVGIVQPAGIWGYADLTAEACKQIGAMYIHLGALENEMCVKMIYDLHISVLDISPSRLWEILDYVNKHNSYPSELFPVSIIMSAGEKLSKEFVNAIYTMYPNISIYDQYGSEELDGLGGTDFCVRNSWMFRLLEDDFIFEVLDKHNNHVKEGTVGKLTVTSLYHRGTPLIRYNLEDLVILKNNRLHVLGREKDWVILYDSVKIHKFQVQECVNSCFDEMVIWQLQISELSNKVILLKLIIDNNEVKDEVVNKLCNKMCRLTIDVYALFQINKVNVEIIFDRSQLIYSKRGKLKSMIDMRNE